MAFPLPIVGGERAVVGKDAVFAAAGFGFDEWLPQRAADFTVISRGGVLQMALAGQSGGGKVAAPAKWQSGGGIARLAITRADNALPMRTLPRQKRAGNSANIRRAKTGGGCKTKAQNNLTRRNMC